MNDLRYCSLRKRKRIFLIVKYDYAHNGLWGNWCNQLTVSLLAMVRAGCGDPTKWLIVASCAPKRAIREAWAWTRHISLFLESQTSLCWQLLVIMITISPSQIVGKQPTTSAPPSKPLLFAPARPVENPSRPKCEEFVMMRMITLCMLHWVTLHCGVFTIIRGHISEKHKKSWTHSKGVERENQPPPSLVCSYSYFRLWSLTNTRIYFCCYQVKKSSVLFF